MGNKTIRQPDKLSIAEWKLLQILATNPNAFDVEDFFASQKTENDKDPDNKPLSFFTFYRQFHHIKNCGYLVSVPLTEEEKKNGSKHQLYRITSAAISVTSTEEEPPPPPKFGRPRKI